MLSLLLLAAMAAVGSRFVRFVPEGELAVARSGDASRYLPPGLHFVNPLRETLDLIPAGAFPVSGIASVVTRDGFPVRVPFSSRVALQPRKFEAAMGSLGGEHPVTMVSRGMEEALALWGSTQDLSFFLPSPGQDAQAPLTEACARLGIRLESLVLQQPDPEVYVFLGEDALSRGDPDASRALIDAALESAPDDARLVTARGLLHEAMGQWSAAEAAYLRALRLQPGIEAPLARLFVHHQAGGEWTRLQELMGDALAANPGSVRLYNWQALTYVGMERYPDAFDVLQRALALDPRSEVTLQNLGSLHLKLGRMEEAAAIYREALAANPNSQPILLGQGVAEMARGDLPAARRALEAARRAGPPSIPVHNALADVYRQSGMNREAAEELRASLQLDPGQEAIRQALAALQGEAP
jgi:tetratricopeptide (TPR) repeat protein